MVWGFCADSYDHGCEGGHCDFVVCKLVLLRGLRLWILIMAAKLPDSIDITTDPGYVVLKFTTAGTGDWTVPDGITECDYCVVAGGGGAGGYISGSANAGGGGGGEVLQGVAHSLVGKSTVTVTVGAGGGTAPLGNPATSGGSSVFDTVTADGGAGGYQAGHGGASGDGHSGGVYNAGYVTAGGGGGDNANGANAGSNGGAGGAGTQCTIDSVYYGGGGAGGGGTTPDYSLGGNNAGGGGEYTSRQHDGSAGIVIVKYAIPTSGGLFTFHG